MSTRKAFFLGGLAVFLVLVLAFVLIGVFVPSSEDEIASVGETPTTAPVPTAMPRMTLNPTATITPLPTATTVPCPTNEEQAYFDSLEGTMRSIGAQHGLMGEDLQRAADNLMLLVDDIWLMGMENAIYNIGIRADNIVALDAPASTKLIDEAADLMALTIKESLASLEYYIDTLDDYAASEYVVAMDDAAADARYIYSSIDRFCN